MLIFRVTSAPTADILLFIPQTWTFFQRYKNAFQCWEMCQHGWGGIVTGTRLGDHRSEGCFLISKSGFCVMSDETQVDQAT